jgi:hypothetical protein
MMVGLVTKVISKLASRGMFRFHDFSRVHEFHLLTARRWMSLVVSLSDTTFVVGIDCVRASVFAGS